MQSQAPEDRALTIRMCKRLGIWPLDRRHRQGPCACPACFGDDPVVMREAESSVDPAQLVHLRAKRPRPKFPWEEGYEAA